MFPGRCKILWQAHQELFEDHDASHITYIEEPIFYIDLKSNQGTR